MENRSAALREHSMIMVGELEKKIQQKNETEKNFLMIDIHFLWVREVCVLME